MHFLSYHGGVKNKIQSRGLNAVAYTLPHGAHMYAPAYTLCPMQGLMELCHHLSCNTLEGSFIAVSKMFQGCLKKELSVLKENFKKLFKGVSRTFQFSM